MTARTQIEFIENVTDAMGYRVTLPMREQVMVLARRDAGGVIRCWCTRCGDPLGTMRTTCPHAITLRRHLRRQERDWLALTGRRPWRCETAFTPAPIVKPLRILTDMRVLHAGWDTSRKLWIVFHTGTTLCVDDAEDGGVFAWINGELSREGP